MPESQINPRRNSSRNTYAFADLSTPEEAARAIEKAHLRQIEDRNITVNSAKPIVPRDPKLKKKDRDSTDAAAASNRQQSRAEPKSARTKEKRERAPADMSSEDSIFIRNLSNRTTKESLLAFLKDLEPAWVHISFKHKMSANTNRPFRQYFAFSKLRDNAAQRQAVSEYSGKTLDGRTVRISAVKDESAEASEAPKESAEETDAKEELTESK